MELNFALACDTLFLITNSDEIDSSGSGDKYFLWIGDGSGNNGDID